MSRMHKAYSISTGGKTSKNQPFTTPGSDGTADASLPLLAGVVPANIKLKTRRLT